MIEIQNIKKIYNRRVKKGNKKYEKINALNNFNLSVKKREIIGLIGPNGAGKTTTLKILSGLITPTTGKVIINGKDSYSNLDYLKDNVGLLPAEFSRSLYWRLTGRQNLKFFSKLRSIKNSNRRIEELISIFDLEDYANEQVMKYSTGTKHKLAFAVTLLHNPSILLLDEPLTGIDPVMSYELKHLIKDTFSDKTIIWSSHNIYEIEEMCNRIVLINKGEKIIEGPPEEIKSNYKGFFKIKIETDKTEVFENFRDTKIYQSYVEISAENITRTYLEICDLIKKENINVSNISLIKPSLEDIIMEIMECLKK